MFSDRLADTLKMLDINQTTMAEITGVSKAAISQYLSGKHEPSKSRKRDMAVRLGLGEDYFLAPVVRIGEDATDFSSEFLTVTQVSTLMKKSPKWVRTGLIEGNLDFGYAVHLGKWDFCIPKDLFRRKTGIDPEDPGTVYNLEVKTAARLLGKSERFIRTGLAEGRFPWGYAVHMNNWSAWISSKRFSEETGVQLGGPDG